MQEIQIKGNMIPKVLELIEAKRGGNQPILSFHSTEPNADVYSLYLDDLLDYIETVKKYACKETAEKFKKLLKEKLEERNIAGWIEDRRIEYWNEDIDKICKEITEG